MCTRDLFHHETGHKRIRKKGKKQKRRQAIGKKRLPQVNTTEPDGGNRRSQFTSQDAKATYRRLIASSHSWLSFNLHIGYSIPVIGTNTVLNLAECPRDFCFTGAFHVVRRRRPFLVGDKYHAIMDKVFNLGAQIEICQQLQSPVSASEITMYLTSSSSLPEVETYNFPLQLFFLRNRRVPADYECVFKHNNPFGPKVFQLLECALQERAAFVPSEQTK